MNVVIAANIKKQSARINANGDEIDPRTKQVIKANVPDPLPPPPDTQEQPPTPTIVLSPQQPEKAKEVSSLTGSPELDQRIEEKVAAYRAELVAKAQAALSQIDL